MIKNGAIFWVDEQGSITKETFGSPYFYPVNNYSNLLFINIKDGIKENTTLMVNFEISGERTILTSHWLPMFFNGLVEKVESDGTLGQYASYFLQVPNTVLNQSSKDNLKTININTCLYYGENIILKSNGMQYNTLNELNQFVTPTEQLSLNYSTAYVIEEQQFFQVKLNIDNNNYEWVGVGQQPLMYIETKGYGDMSITLGKGMINPNPLPISNTIVAFLMQQYNNIMQRLITNENNIQEIEDFIAVGTPIQHLFLNEVELIPEYVDKSINLKVVENYSEETSFSNPNNVIFKKTGVYKSSLTFENTEYIGMILNLSNLTINVKNVKLTQIFFDYTVNRILKRICSATNIEWIENIANGGEWTLGDWVIISDFNDNNSLNNKILLVEEKIDNHIVDVDNPHDTQANKIKSVFSEEIDKNLETDLLDLLDLVDTNSIDIENLNNSKANDSDVVHKTNTDEDIDGIKNFLKKTILLMVETRKLYANATTQSGTGESGINILENGIIELFSLANLISMRNARITNVANAIETKDAINLGQLREEMATGIHPVSSSMAISTNNISSISGFLVIDGYQTLENDVVLLWKQNNQEENGLYIVKSGSWQRIEKGNGNEKGATTSVLGGNTYFGYSMYALDENAYIWDIHTPNIQYTGGDGILVDGTTINIKALSIVDNMISASAGIKQSKIENLVTNLTEIKQSVINEMNARTNADTTLQTNIDDEATSREEADTLLQENIDAEATARTNADTTLQNNINAEATARANKDAVIDTDLSYKFGESRNRALFNNQSINGITLTQNSDGTITLNGTATSGATLYLTDKEELNAKQLGVRIDYVSGSMSGANISLQDTGNGNLILITPANYTASKTATKKFVSYPSVYISTNTVLNNLVLKINIELSTTAPNSWTSPIPNYPSLEQNKDYVFGRSRNLALLNVDNSTQYNVAMAIDKSNQTVAFTSTGATAGYIIIANIFLKAGTYTFKPHYLSGTFLSSSGGNDTQSVYVFNDTGTSIATATINSSASTSASFTITTDMTISIRARFYANQTCSSFAYRIQLELGSIATEWSNPLGHKVSVNDVKEKVYWESNNKLKITTLPKTVQGVKVSLIGDSILMNGTATGSEEVYLCDKMLQYVGKEITLNMKLLGGSVAQGTSITLQNYHVDGSKRLDLYNNQIGQTVSVTFIPNSTNGLQPFLYVTTSRVNYNNVNILVWVTLGNKVIDFQSPNDNLPIPFKSQLGKNHYNSDNLALINSSTHTSNGIVQTVDIENQITTFNGTPTYGHTRVIATKIFLNKGTYCLSPTYLIGTYLSGANAALLSIYLRDSNNTSILFNTADQAASLYGDGRIKSGIITLISDTYVDIVCWTTGAWVLTDFAFQIKLEEGSIATEWTHPIGLGQEILLGEYLSSGSTRLRYGQTPFTHVRFEFAVRNDRYKLGSIEYELDGSEYYHMYVPNSSERFEMDYYGDITKYGGTSDVSLVVYGIKKY